MLLEKFQRADLDLFPLIEPKQTKKNWAAPLTRNFPLNILFSKGFYQKPV